MPVEVLEELRGDPEASPVIEQKLHAAGVRIVEGERPISPWLLNSLDKGEAAVIELAMEKQTGLVAIDERAGRRVARLCNLQVTGSLGILLTARRYRLVPPIQECLLGMTRAGIWLSNELKAEALQLESKLSHPDRAAGAE